MGKKTGIKPGTILGPRGPDNRYKKKHREYVRRYRARKRREEAAKAAKRKKKRGGKN